ncbi:MAG: hypothetical protein ACT4O3_08605 [Elusimicrobiota bacterium]
MSELSEAEREEKRKAHIRVLRHITLWSGWLAAFASMALGGYLVDRLKAELKEARAACGEAAGGPSAPKEPVPAAGSKELPPPSPKP